MTKYDLRDKLESMESEFEILGVSPEYRIDYQGLIDSEAIKQRVLKILERLKTTLESDKYPYVSLGKSAQEVIIYQCFETKGISKWIDNEVKKFETELGVKIKIGRYKTKISAVYLEADKTINPLKSVAETLRVMKIKEAENERV